MVSPTRRERWKDDPPRERIFSISSGKILSPRGFGEVRVEKAREEEGEGGRTRNKETALRNER